MNGLLSKHPNGNYASGMALVLAKEVIEVSGYKIYCFKLWADVDLYDGSRPETREVNAIS